MSTGVRPVFRRSLVAEPTAPSLLRRAFRAWLDRWHWPGEEADDLVIALSEAASNVVEHAYRASAADRPGDLRVYAEIVPGRGGARRVRATVVDSGRWRPIPSDRGYRGHGLRVMRACSAWLGVDPTPTGTCVTMFSRPCAGGAHSGGRADGRAHSGGRADGRRRNDDVA